MTADVESALRAAYDQTADLPIRAPGPLPAVPRRPRWVAPAAAAASVAVLVGGVYVASRAARPADPAPAAPTSASATTSPVRPAPPTVRQPVPGGERIVLVGPLVVREGTGAMTVDLGPAPPGANAVANDLSCLAAGEFEDAFGSTMSCDRPEHIWDEPVPLNAREGTGTHVFSFSGTGRYRVRLGWATRTILPLATNARGQTYGSNVNHLDPDLVAVSFGKGQSGYVLRTDLEGEGPPRTPMTTNPPPRTIPVYESDGVTVIGEFGIGGGRDVPMPSPSKPSPAGMPYEPMGSATPSPAG